MREGIVVLIPHMPKKKNPYALTAVKTEPLVVKPPRDKIKSCCKHCHAFQMSCV